MIRFLFALLALVCLTACDDTSASPEGLSCGELCGQLCTRMSACSDDDTGDVEQACRARCDEIGEDDWGDVVAMTPLACTTLDDCNAFRLCQLRGGEAGFACGGHSPTDDPPPLYPETCAGLCSYRNSCDPDSWYQPDCVRYCQDGIREGWVNPRVLGCAASLTCDRLTICIEVLYYDVFTPGDDNMEPGDVEVDDVFP